MIDTGALLVLGSALCSAVNTIVQKPLFARHHPLTISASHPGDGISMFIPSGFLSRIWNCTINGFVQTLREDQWTWHDSIRYSSGCTVAHGSSGSPIVSVASGEVVGINNTNNDNSDQLRGSPVPMHCRRV